MVARKLTRRGQSLPLRRARASPRDSRVRAESMWLSAGHSRSGQPSAIHRRTLTRRSDSGWR